jgi:hypothetical protein
MERHADVERQSRRQGIDTEEIIATVHARRAPMITAGLRL